MSLTPISRDEMRQRKPARDIAVSAQYISQLVKKIYNGATQIADTTKDTVYRYEPSPNTHDEHVLITYKDDVIQNLRFLFPDCLVEHKSGVIQGAYQKIQTNSIIVDWT